MSQTKAKNNNPESEAKAWDAKGVDTGSRQCFWTRNLYDVCKRWIWQKHNRSKIIRVRIDRDSVKKCVC